MSKSTLFRQSSFDGADHVVSISLSPTTPTDEAAHHHPFQNVAKQLATPANQNFVEELATPANQNFVEELARPTNQNFVEQLATPTNQNFVEQLATPTYETAAKRLLSSAFHSPAAQRDSHSSTPVSTNSTVAVRTVATHTEATPYEPISTNSTSKQLSRTTTNSQSVSRQPSSINILRTPRQ
jgi:hypothetical protein